MERHVELFCRDQLRDARHAVLRDAEAFPELLFAFERVGAIALGQQGDLGQYKKPLLAIAARSALAGDSPPVFGSYHSTADTLYELVRNERNDALHHGSFARHLAVHATELSLLLEDGLVNGTNQLADLMVRTPLCAELWHPLSHVRREMLTNSFSYLPTYVTSMDGLEEGWYLLSDLALSRVLHGCTRKQREHRLFSTVREALAEHGLRLIKAPTTSAKASVDQVLQRDDDRPTLVLDDAGHLIGIVTPFDVL